MQLSYRVKYDDGRDVVAVVKPADIVKFEQRFATSFLELGRGTRAEWIFFLAWSPLNRDGSEPRSFEDFLGVVTDVEADEQAEEAAPFEPAPSEGSSPDSPAVPA